MICRLKFKKDVRTLLSQKCCFKFYGFGFEAMHHLICFSLSLWIKLTMDQLLLFFLCNLSSFSATSEVLLTNHFSLLLTDKYILAIQQIMTHKEHLRYSWRSSELPQKPWHHVHNNRSGWNSLGSHFYWTGPAIVAIFCWCMLCMATSDISSLSENIRLSFLF